MASREGVVTLVVERADAMCGEHLRCARLLFEVKLLLQLALELVERAQPRLHGDAHSL